MSDVIVVMRDGLIQQLGSPEALYLRPRNRFVAGFMGSSNFVPAKVAAPPDDTRRVRVTVAGGPTFVGLLTDDARPPEGAEVTVAIRPEGLLLGETGSQRPPTGPGWSSLPGRVVSGTYLGDQSEYRVAVPEFGELVSRVQNDALAGDARAFGPGESVVVWWREDATLILTS